MWVLLVHNVSKQVVNELGIGFCKICVLRGLHILGNIHRKTAMYACKQKKDVEADCISISSLLTIYLIYISAMLQTSTNGLAGLVIRTVLTPKKILNMVLKAPIINIFMRKLGCL
jgi:hypothetical protein